MVLKRSVSRCACIIAATLFLCGPILIVVHPTVFKIALSMTPNSIVYKLWKDVPFDIAVDMFFFNWTNPQDIYNTSVKPKFREVGPYRFWQKEDKQNITWNDNGTITFLQRRFWYYDETVRKNGLLDNITTVNTIPLTAAYLSRSWNYLYRKAVSFTVSGLTSHIYATHTVGDLLFDGYKEPLIRIARSTPLFASFGFPDWGRFGWFYQRNGSSDFDGVFNMGTGTNSLFGNIYNWNYANTTDYFEGECGKVEGSLGEFFSRNLGRDTITMFAVETRRLVLLKYAGNETVNGIFGYKYIGEDHMLDNGTIHPENKCFCNGECVPSGVANLSLTKFGIPLFGSLPHFYRADPYYVNSVEGLQPDGTKHEFSFTIEPSTGIPLEVNARVQANLLLQPIRYLSLYEQVPRIFMPILWVQQSFKLSGTTAFLLKLVLAIPTICISIGSLMVATSFALTFYIISKKCWNKKQCKKANDSLSLEQLAPLKERQLNNEVT